MSSIWMRFSLSSLKYKKVSYYRHSTVYRKKKKFSTTSNYGYRPLAFTNIQEKYIEGVMLHIVVIHYG